MPAPTVTLDQIRALNASAGLNRWSDMQVLSAGEGRAELALAWRAEFGQYAGFLHTGMLGALIDTACGFAAATLVGRVLASHFSVNCMRPAVGDRFIARAHVVKPGRTQVFTACEVFAYKGAQEALVATGETLLVVVGDSQPQG